MGFILNISNCLSGIEILVSGEDTIFQCWEIGNLNLYVFLKNKAEWFTVPGIRAGNRPCCYLTFQNTCWMWFPIGTDGWTHTRRAWLKINVSNQIKQLAMPHNPISSRDSTQNTFKKKKSIATNCYLLHIVIKWNGSPLYYTEKMK